MVNYNVLYLGPCGLTLPGRDYYLDDQFSDKRQFYLQFLKDFSDFFNLNLDPLEMMELETKLAKLHLKPEEKRNPDNVYFPKDRDTIVNAYKLPLNKYFELLGKSNVKQEDKIICSNEVYFEKFMEGLTINQLKTYLKFKTCLRFSRYSQGELYQLIFNFFGKKLSGQEEPLPQWKRTINLVNCTLGELLAKEYVAKHFSEESKKEVSEMISYFKGVLKEMIERNTWMETSTKMFLVCSCLELLLSNNRPLRTQR